MMPKKRERKGMSARLYLRGNDHRDAVYNITNEYGATNEYAYLTGMYYEGTVNTYIPDVDIDVDIPEVEVPEIETPEVDTGIDIPGVDIETPEIETPEIEVPQIDTNVPEIDMPVTQPTKSDDPMETGFVWKSYPKLAVLTTNNALNTSNTAESYYGISYGFAVTKMDTKTPFILHDYDLSIGGMNAVRTDDYVIISAALNGQYLFITKDGYEWRRINLSGISSYYNYRLHRMGNSRFCFLNSYYSGGIYCDILDLEERDVRIHEFSCPIPTGFSTTGISAVFSIVAGHSYSGLLLTYGNYPDYDKIHLVEVRPSGTYYKHIFEMNYKARSGNASFDESTNIGSDSFKMSEIIQCGGYYIFATHRVSVIGTRGARPWGTITVWKSTNLDDWSFEVLEENYDSMSLKASPIKIVERDDVCYIYTTVSVLDSGYSWKAKGYYATRGQHWNELSFPNEVEFATYDPTQTGSDPLGVLKLGMNSSSTSTNLYNDLMKNAQYDMYGIRATNSPSCRLNDGVFNIFWEYGKLQKTYDLIGFACKGWFMFCNPSFSNSDKNFAIYKVSASNVWYEIEKVKTGDYCVK